MKYQIGTSSLKHGGRRYLPYVFTEQGVAMLSAVLRSETAVNVSIQIMDTFVEMRKVLMNNMLAKRNPDVEATIYTQKINPQLLLYLYKHNTQYTAIELKTLPGSHDRFLVMSTKNFIV